MKAMQAFAAADFHWTRGLRDVWAQAPYHVDGLHGDLADRVVADFFARTRATDSNPIGQVLSGRAGSGKTHLLGTLRRRVWEGGGWFVLIDFVGIADFWAAAALAFLESLSRATPSGHSQAGAILRAVLKTLSADPAARAAATGPARPLLAKGRVVDLLLAMLAAVEPAGARRHQDAVRALALLDSRNFDASTFAAMWLQGHDGEEARRRELGFVAGPPPAAEIVRGLLWIMALAGPTLIAVDQIDAVVSEANAAAGEAETHKANTPLQSLAGGLMDLHDMKRRAMTLVSSLEATWPLLKEKTVASAADRFRELPALPPIASADVVARLLGERLTPIYTRAGFAPPYPTYPFTRAAVESAVGLRPRAILMRAQAHQDACRLEGGLRECVSLAESAAAAPFAATDNSALDEAFARARAVARPPSFDDEDAVAPLLVGACELYLRQLSWPESIDGEASADLNPQNPALHARLAFVFHEQGGRQRRWGFRLIPQDNALAFQSRLSAAVVASGVEADIASRRLIVLRAAPPPAGPKTAEHLLAFDAAGGQFLAPSVEDFAIFAAVRQLDEAQIAGFDAWLRRRKPLFETKLFQTAGLAPPDFLDEFAEPRAPASEIYAPAPPTAYAALSPPGAFGLAEAPAQAFAPPAQRDMTHRALGIGRSAEPGEIIGPVTLLAAWLPQRVAVVAGAGRGVLLSRIVEEAALAGVPTLVLDLHNEFARLGERWPARPPDFSDEDARKAKAYFEQVEVVVWTPGVSGGRPLHLPLLPDFAALGSDADGLEERERALEMALASLEPSLAGRGPKAIRQRGVLADGLRAFARAGGGALDDLVRLMHDLPASASRIPEAAEIAREIARRLVVTMAANPLFGVADTPFDPAELFAGETGRTRVSVVNLSGLASEAARDFVNRLQMTLFCWIKAHPGPTERLYVLDEAHDCLPAKETTPCKRSAFALAAQGAKYGLGMVFATGEPRALDPAAISGCLTQIYGRMSSPAGLETVRAMMAARGGSADDLSRLKPGEFYFVTDGFSRPIKIRAPLCLSRRAQNPLTTEEVAAIARRRA